MKNQINLFKNYENSKGENYLNENNPNITKANNENVEYIQNLNLTDMNHVYEIQVSFIREKGKRRKQIITPTDSADLARELIGKQINSREHFYAFYFDISNKYVGHKLISIGGINSTVVDIRVIAQSALLLNAVGVIIIHNHPSGNLTFSNADKHISKKAKEALKLLDITLLDSIVVTDEDYSSLMTEGEL